MRYATIVLLMVIAAVAFGQVTVTGTVPANGSTSVGLNSVLTITFSAAIDTTLPFLPGEQFLTNVDSVNALWWSADRRTFNASAVLKPNTAYFIVVMTAHPAGGGTFAMPYATHWSTGSTFPANHYSVSGSVLSGTTGVSPAYAIVVMSEGTVLGGEGDPRFLAADVADAGGMFTVPYVPGVQAYPVAAKDANGDGQIDPSQGDVVAEGSPFTPSGNVTGISLTFMSFAPLKWSTARDSALAFAAANLPPTRQLRLASCWDIDTTGATSDWQFVYTVPGNPVPSAVYVSSTGEGFDSNPYSWSWIWQCKPMPSVSTAALADSVIAKAERAGGKAFRQLKPAGNDIVNRIGISLGNLHWTNFWQLATDSTKFYWGVEYRYDTQVTQDSSYAIARKLFLADWATGNILGVTAVEGDGSASIPEKFTLEQNYPNPFNPVTLIRYQLPVVSEVKLVLYDMLGRATQVLVNEKKEAGVHEVKCDASGLSSGVYFYRLQAGDFVQTRRLVLLK